MTLKSRLQNLLTDASPPTAAAADPINLDSTFAKRTMQLAAAREAAAARLADQRAQADRVLRAAERAHADEVEALAATERSTHAALRAGLVRDAQGVFGPLVTRWRDEPSRALAMQVFEALVTLVRRELDELGPTGSNPHALLALGHVFEDQVARNSPGALVMLAHGSSTERVVCARGLIMRDAVLPALQGATVSSGGLENLVAELEASIESVATSNRDRPLETHTLTRWALVRAQDPDALQHFDAEVARERAEQALANYHPPINTAEGGGRAHQYDGAAAVFG